MNYKQKCSSTDELVAKLSELVQQIENHHTILVDWQEVEIPEETVFAVRYVEHENGRQLKFKIIWGEVEQEK